MKKITFIIVMAFAAINLSATNKLKIADFEDGLNYFTKVSAGFVDILIVDNPSITTVNNSAKVLKFKYYTGYPNYAVALKEAGTIPALPLPIGNLEEIVAGKYRYATLKLYKPFKSKILFTLKKASAIDGQTPQYLNQKINEWEDITIDMLDVVKGSSVAQNVIYDGIMLNLDKSGRTPASTEGFVAYIDDLYLSNDLDVTTDISNHISGMGIIVVHSNDGQSLVNVSNADHKSFKLEVYNMQGQLVKIIYNGISESGTYKIPVLSKGNYILKATTENKVQNIKF